MTDHRTLEAKTMTPERAYRLGYDCGFNGSNLTNCDFRIFSTPENTKEWERGKQDAENAKRLAIAQKGDGE